MCYQTFITLQYNDGGSYNCDLQVGNTVSEHLPLYVSSKNNYTGIYINGYYRSDNQECLISLTGPEKTDKGVTIGVILSLLPISLVGLCIYVVLVKLNCNNRQNDRQNDGQNNVQILGRQIVRSDDSHNGAS